MAGICTNSIRKGGAGCDHRIVSVLLDGEAFDLHCMEADIDALPWDEGEKRQFILLGLKRLRVAGMTLDEAIGRVTNGEEATNVKQYALLMKDVTKNNIGAAWVNVCVGANGERSLVEFTGCTEFRLVVNANLVGVGPFGARVIRDGDQAVLYENENIALTGERELDTGWLPVPEGVESLEVVRFQAKSATAGDDPIFRRCILLVR